MLPIRRNLKFKLAPEKINNWHPKGQHVSHFTNTLSSVFPVGERFFIDSVRHYRKNGSITNPALLAEVSAFIGQEALHGREHDQYNKAYADAGANTVVLERWVLKLLNAITKHTPPAFSLSATIALEHYTAILANALLAHPQLLEGADKDYLALWNWHALEETEHKSVAYDVYREVMKDSPLTGYTVRVVGQIAATVLLWSIIYPAYVDNVRRTGGLFKLRGWRTALRFQFGRFGILRVTLRDYLDYFRPGFHPWDQDNRHLLSKIDEITQQYAEAA